MLLLRKNPALFIIIILLTTSVVLFIEKQELKYSLIDFQSIPHIDLTNTLDFGSSSFTGEIRGFVVFENKEDQPKDLRQYYIIEPINQRDEKSNQVFLLDDVIVLSPLPPTSIGKTLLLEKNESGEEITLVDEDGNQFFINKASKEVSMIDATGDMTRLITSNSDYKDFMWQYLKK